MTLCWCALIKARGKKKAYVRVYEFTLVVVGIFLVHFHFHFPRTRRVHQGTRWDWASAAGSWNWAGGPAGLATPFKCIKAEGKWLVHQGFWHVPVPRLAGTIARFDGGGRRGASISGMCERADRLVRRWDGGTLHVWRHVWQLVRAAVDGCDTQGLEVAFKLHCHCGCSQNRKGKKWVTGRWPPGWQEWMLILCKYVSANGCGLISVVCGKRRPTFRFFLSKIRSYR